MTPGIAALSVLLGCTGAFAQQVADPTFDPVIAAPAYPRDEGPVVRIDEAHHNFHTVDGRYAPFAEVLRRDGYRVEPHREPFTLDSLAGAEVLVVANAIAEANVDRWTRPIAPAFAAEEIEAVRDWVRRGGALLLIADHMPFAGAAAELGRAFGLEFCDSYAVPAAAADGGRRGPTVFARADGTLGEHRILDGRRPDERVDTVVTFTGQGFRATKRRITPLLHLPEGMILLEPHEAGVFDDDTPRRPASGWLQGAALRRGRGRVVVLGEAAMFSAQRSGETQRPFGMNAPEAAQNLRLLLNTMHWLSRARR